MKISQLSEKLNYQLIQPGDPAADIMDGYTSDLLSDVMANAKEGSVLITIQAHKNTVAVASLIGAPAILICNSRSIPDDFISSAKNEQIAVLSTTDNQFNASHKIYQLLKS